MAAFVGTAPTVWNRYGLVQPRRPEMWHSSSFPQLPAQLCPGQRSTWGLGRSPKGLQRFWPTKEEGLAITGNLCSPHHQLPVGASTKCRSYGLNSCLAISPPPRQSLCSCPPLPPHPQPPDSFTKPHWCSHCDICEARSPHNKNTLGKCLGSNVCLNWPDESHLDWVCAILLATKYSHRRGCEAMS